MNDATNLPARKAPFNYMLVTDSDPFFVINQVGNEEREDGPVVLNVEIGNGISRPVNIKNTWIPQDLCDQALPTQLARNLELRQLVNRRLIKVISPEEAEAFMKRPSAVNEMKRLQAVTEERMAGRGSRLDGNSGATVLDQREMARRAAMQNDPRNPSVKEEVPTVDRHSQHGPGKTNFGIEVVDRFRKGNITLEEACSSMKGVGLLLDESQKNKLRAIQNVPPELIAAIAAIE